MGLTEKRIELGPEPTVSLEKKKKKASRLKATKNFYEY